MVTGNSGTVTASGSMVILASTTGNVGIGTASPALGFDVNVAAVFRQAVTVAGTVTVNSLISNIYGVFGQNVTVNSTNASISTTTGALVVAGGVGIGGNVYASGNVVAASLQPTSASVPGAGLFLPATNTIAVSTASTERMRIDTNGNVIIKGAVGVGTSTAAGMSTTGVSSNLYVWGNLIVANTALTSSGIYFPNGSYLTTGTYGPTNTIQVAGSGNALLGDSGSFVWDLANRRLGIGTSTPSYQLSVYGTDYVLFNTRPGGATRQEITVGNVASFGAVLGYDPSLAQSIGYLRRGDSAATTPAIAWNYVSSNYRVGINGITIPQNALDVNGALAVGNNYAGVVTGPNNGMIVQGTVGIGTGTPTTNANNQLTLFNATAAGIELATGGATPGGANIIGITGGGLTFATFTGGVGSEVYTERMRINSNGAVTMSTPLVIGSGGTGLGTVPANGQLLIGNGTNYTLATLTQGSGVSITNAAGSITIAATGSGGTVTSLTAGTGVILSPSTITTTGTISIGQSVATSASPTFANLTVAGYQIPVNGFVGTQDLNTLTSSGMYRFDVPSANGIVGVNFGQILVMHGAADTITQIIGDYASSRLYTRSGNPSNVGGGGSWGAWRSLIDTVGGQTISGTLTTTNTLTTTGITFSVANPVLSSSSYVNLTGGLYVSGGTLYSQVVIYARGGIGNDAAAALSITGGTSNITNVTGALNATGEITAYSSDSRLKKNVELISDPFAKLNAIRGVMFDWDADKAKALGFDPVMTHDVGVIAQEVAAVLPEAVRPAPFDIDGDGNSKSGENYLTVQYEKLTALLIEAVKAQQEQISKLEARITTLELDP